MSPPSRRRWACALRPTTSRRRSRHPKGIFVFVQASTKEVIAPMPSGAFASPGPYRVVVFLLIIKQGGPVLQRSERLDIFGDGRALLLPANILIPGLVEPVGNILAND